ncbi:MAG: kynureninase [Phycisphaerales bacterium]|nr:kynureninase [Phycisphaerales bacterium]
MTTAHRGLADVAEVRRLDEHDPVASMRDRFAVPVQSDGSDVIYLCGNSLGLLPLTATDYVNEVMDEWRRLGVAGHLQARTPWYSYHEVFREQGSRLVGAKPCEVVMMNSLTINLHLLLTSFYRPEGSRTKLLMEMPAFPSDIYCLQTHLQARGLCPEEHIIQVRPRQGSDVLDTGDILAAIEEAGDSLATIMMGGVNFLTGQVLDMAAIAEAGHRVGAMVGFDLAHAAGNVPLRLHDWNVDFGAWCSYKYLNAGPGAIAGAFVHERHATNTALPRLAGWWGNDPDTRFRMHLEDAFVPVPSADSWQTSNPPILSMAPLRASLDLFDAVGMESLRSRSLRLTRFLREQLEAVPNRRYRITTPQEAEAHGCQLSIAVDGDAQQAFETIESMGVVADFRPPNTIRVAPTPLYNTFEDCHRFAVLMGQSFGTLGT